MKIECPIYDLSCPYCVGGDCCMEEIPMRNAMPSSEWKTSRGTMRWGLTLISGAIPMIAKRGDFSPSLFSAASPRS